MSRSEKEETSFRGEDPIIGSFGGDDRPGLLDLPDMRFPELYVWLLFVSSLQLW